jgi:hypothetical protein
MTCLPCKKISLEECNQLLQSSRLIRNGYLDRPKVLERDGMIIKFFYYDRLPRHRQVISLRGRRFIQRAFKLPSYGIKTIKPVQYMRCKARSCEIIVYPKMEGISVYESLVASFDPALFQRFAAYVAHLHDKGIYFKAGHSDNYLIDPKGDFLLIDVDNCRFTMYFLRRVKNLVYLIDHARGNQYDLYMRYGEDRFINDYLKCANIKPSKHKKFHDLIKKHLAAKGYYEKEINKKE